MNRGHRCTFCEKSEKVYYFLLNYEEEVQIFIFLFDVLHSSHPIKFREGVMKVHCCLEVKLYKVFVAYK